MISNRQQILDAIDHYLLETAAQSLRIQRSLRGQCPTCGKQVTLAASFPRAVYCEQHTPSVPLPLKED